MPTPYYKPPSKWMWYAFLRRWVWMGAIVVFRYRAFGVERVPADGPLLLCSNHQSHFDPPLIGGPIPRQLHYLAREDLFHLPGFNWLIRSLDAIPIDREGLGLSGIKQTLRLLKSGEAVVVFPEGTRTYDGEVADFRPGILTLARRAKAPLAPCALDGGFQAWPRGQTIPGFGPIVVQYGEPIWPEDFEGVSDEELLAELRRRIVACHQLARRRRTAMLDERWTPR